MADDAARLLYEALGRGDHRSAIGDPDFKAQAEAVRARLKALSMALYPYYEAAQNAGDYKRADAIDDAISQIDILRISIAQSIVRYLDDAPDVAEACKAIDAVSGRLKAAADHAEQSAADLGKVTTILDGLTKLVGFVADA